MNGETHFLYDFAGFRLDPAHRTLLRDGKPVALTPKGFDTLLLLVQNRDRVLEKEELMKALWPESFVEDGNLSQSIFILRKILGDDRNGNSFIQTIPRRGYKFVAPVTEVDASVPENGFPGAPQFSPGYWSHHSPFRALQVFEPEDSWLFFGRETETSDLLERLARSPVLAVVGNSGSGKSSLIRAGLVPALRDGHSFELASLEGFWRIAIFRPSAATFDYLAEVLVGQLAPELGLEEQTAFIADCRRKLPLGGDSLRNAISALANVIADETGQPHILLVADQFEEIFTLTTNRDTRSRYIDALLAASRLDSAVPVHLVLALRADFYGHCLEHAELSRCLGNNLYNVPRMTHEQLRETIEKRLALASAHAEPGLIDSLLEDVGDEPGNLALLEHALGQLWEKCGGPGCTLTTHAYSEIGRLRGALGRHADEVYQSIGDANLKQLVQKIFLELVHLGEGAGVQDTRRRVRKADLLCLGTPQEVELLLARLASSRLISIGREGEEVLVEVSHEALIREWPLLRDWLNQNREELGLQRRLLQAAEEWDSLKRDQGALLRGARLAQGEEWLVRHVDASPLLCDFVQAGITARNEAERKELAAQEREAARQKAVAVRLRWFSCALAVLMLLAAGAAWYTYRLNLIEKSRALAAQSEEMWPRDQGQALDLAIRSWHIAKTDEARLAVTKAFPQVVATLNHDGAVYSAIFSPDGERMLTTSQDHTARLWSSRDGQILSVLRGHTDDIWRASFSPDGQRIVTASLDHTARVWNTADGHLVAILRGHADEVYTAMFSRDGQRIVTASKDHTARLWSSADGRLLAILQGHTNVVASAAFSPDGQRVVTASQDGTARIWSSSDGHLLAILAGHTGEIFDAQFSSDGRRVVTAGWDHTAIVWNSADGRLLFVLHQSGAITQAVFSLDGKRIITAGFDQTARVWDSADGRLLATLQGHTGTIAGMGLSPDGRRIVSASTDRTARVWDITNGHLLTTLQGHTGGLGYAEFAPDGERIVTASEDHTARIWNISAACLLVTTLQGHTSAITEATFSSDSRRVITASVDRTARVWNSADGRLLATLQGHTGPIWRLVLSSDGRRIVTASSDHTARVWDSADGHLLSTLQGHTDVIYEASFSPDGQRVVTASRDHSARLWNAADGRLLAILVGHTGAVWRAQFSPDGQHIVTASDDHTARIWNSADGRLLTILQGHTGLVWGIQFSPDGQRIVTASVDHTARVWDAADGHLLTILVGHTDTVRQAQFSPDGQRVATASFDHTARVWNSADGRLLAILRGHTDQVWGARFSPDGQRIVTASYDGTARLWNNTDYQLLTTFQGHDEAVWDASFSPDGQRILTASYDQTVRVWRVLTLNDIEQILSK